MSKEKEYEFLRSYVNEIHDILEGTDTIGTVDLAIIRMAEIHRLRASLAEKDK